MLNDAVGFSHIFIKTGRTDMRLGIDGLIGVVNGAMGLDPTDTGSIFLFCGRKHDRIKALIFEGDGWLLCYKRLTGKSSFKWPKSEIEVRQLDEKQFRWLMEGLQIDQKKAIEKMKPDIY